MELNIPLTAADSRHLYEQIYEYIRDEIRAGRLQTGEKLPSTRQLASSLRIARTTVELAYEQLEEEGYIDIRRGSGAYVCEISNIPEVMERADSCGDPAGKGQNDSIGQPNGHLQHASHSYHAGHAQDGEKKVRSGRNAADAREKDPGREWIDFSPRTIDMSMFPYATWRRILRGILTGDRAELFHRGDPRGDLELRTTIAHYLHLSRGCNCEPEQIVVGAGNDYLLMLLSLLLREDSQQTRQKQPISSDMTGQSLRSEDAEDAEDAENAMIQSTSAEAFESEYGNLAPRRIAMEPATYLRAAQVLQAEGYEIVPVASDAGGMQVRSDGSCSCNGESLMALEDSDCQLVYVMPARQFPTGVVMPYPRRAELLAWAAQEENRYIIEDDYDSEFKYRGRPVPSLQSSDENGCVIYMGTFSKSIAPAIRVSYLILPQRLLRIYDERVGFLSCSVPRLDQAILNEFLRDGYFERYLNRMRNRYKAKHDRLLELLQPLEKDFIISGQGAGLHLILRPKSQVLEKIDQLTAAGQIAERLPAGAGGEREFSKAAEDVVERVLTEAAAEASVRVYPMSEQLLQTMKQLPASGIDGVSAEEQRSREEKSSGEAENGRQPAILLGYAALSEEELEKGVAYLRSAWENLV